MATGRLYAIQVIYKHELMHTIVRGPVSGNNAEDNCIIREMDLFPHEVVQSVHIRTEEGVQILTLSTSYNQKLTVQVNAAEASKFVFSRTEFRAMNFVGSQFKNLSVKPKIGGNGRVIPPTTASQRFQRIANCFSGNYERLVKLKPARIADLTQEWDSTTYQVYAIHGLVSILEAHQLVHSTRLAAECLKLADLHGSNWWALTISNSFFATSKADAVPKFNAIAEQLAQEAKKTVCARRGAVIQSGREAKR